MSPGNDYAPGRNAQKSEKMAEKPTIGRWLLAFAVCLASGVVFGFALEKGRVFEPLNIRLQMVFRRWIMMKMFLGAMGVGCGCLWLLSILPVPWLQNKFEDADEAYAVTMRGRNALPLALGPFILGVGMTLSGACPGMVLPQVGAWARQSILTLMGALVGALVYGLLHDKVVVKIFPPGKFTLPENVSDVLPVSRKILAPILSVLVLAIVLVLELVVPWKKDLSWGFYHSSPYYTVDDQDAPTFFQLIAWPPSICGVLIGLLQIPIVLVVVDTLGGSSSYSTLVSQPFVGDKARAAFPYLAAAQRGLGNWWQVFFVTGGILGGAISAAASETLGTVEGVHPAFAFCGGFLLLFGARLGSGCTSGHGLSGMGLLYTGALVAVPAMFAGAISTAFALDAAGQLEKLYAWV